MAADKVKMLREAFDKTMKDPEFIADAKRSKLDVDPEDGAHLEKLIREIYTTPKAIVDQVGKKIDLRLVNRFPVRHADHFACHRGQLFQRHDPCHAQYLCIPYGGGLPEDGDQGKAGSGADTNERRFARTGWSTRLR